MARAAKQASRKESNPRDKDTSVKKERHSTDPKSSVRAPPKKAGGGGRFTLGRPGDESVGSQMDWKDPAYDPDEKRVDPDDGVAYKYDELAAFYKGKFSKEAIKEYWEYECKIVKTARAPKKNPPQGPSLEESAAKSKKKKAQGKDRNDGKQPEGKRLTEDAMTPDGPLAKEIAATIPIYPFKGLDKFYDVQGLLKSPKLFNIFCSVMAKRYRKMGITKLLGFEARGFLFTPIALKLQIPFIMLRKEGGMPNTIKSSAYKTEYSAKNVVCLQRDAIEKGDKVVLFDDLIATGGTLCAGVELVKSCEAEVVECGTMVEIKALKGREKCLSAGAKSVWSFMSEDILTNTAKLPDMATLMTH